MRSFCEEWSPIVNRQPMADENKTTTAVSNQELDEHRCSLKAEGATLIINPSFAPVLRRPSTCLDMGRQKNRASSFFRARLALSLPVQKFASCRSCVACFCS